MKTTIGQAKREAQQENVIEVEINGLAMSREEAAAYLQANFPNDGQRAITYTDSGWGSEVTLYIETTN